MIKTFEKAATNVKYKKFQAKLLTMFGALLQTEESLVETPLQNLIYVLKTARG